MLAQGILVPALSHIASDGVTKRAVWSALPSCEYVDSVFGTNSLMPKDPYERAIMQIWCDKCINGIEPSFHKALSARNPEKRKGNLKFFFEKCRHLARAMDATGPFFLGDRFSMVDVVFAPLWQRALWGRGEYMQSIFPDDSDIDRLNTWWEAASTRPSIASTLVCQSRLVASYWEYDLKLAPSDTQTNISASVESK